MPVILTMDFGAGVGRGRGVFMDTPITPVGRGRGRAWFQSTPITSNLMPNVEDISSTDDAFASPPQIGCVGHDLPGTTASNSSVHVIASIAKEIGMSIGESIASCIASQLSSGAGTNVGSNTSGARGADPSLVNWVVKSEVREPVCFKGNGLDAYTVHEWETVVMTYLRKQAIPVAEQAEKGMNRLMGKAREVVRVGIRSNPLLVLSDGPGPIFDILKQHFSDTVSSIMPLADFYSTLPFPSEDSFE